MRRTLLLLLTLLGFPALSASAQDLKALESQLKAEYEGKLVRVDYPAVMAGFRLELPKSERKSLEPQGVAYLRLESMKLRNNQLEFRARRVAFYLNSDDEQRGVLGSKETYRLRWEEKNLDPARLRQTLAQLLPVRNTADEEWALLRAMQASRASLSDDAQRKPGEEVAPGVFATGGDVGVPTCKYCPNPEYPDEMRADRRAGLVVLHCVVTEHGQVRAIRVVKSAGRYFDEAAVMVVARWRLKSAQRHGKPVAVSLVVEIRSDIF